MATRKRTLSNDADLSSPQKEWDEALCPICMDYPHNAVLIICSSHNKGCRSFICDTSYRHSNCLDRFKKPKQENTETGTVTTAATSIPALRHDSNDSSSMNIVFEEQEGLVSGQRNTEKLSERVPLRCPLCRGKVLGWKVMEDARKYLNLKLRSCSRESCLFCGDYGELRRHARRDHPTVRPADIDPSRQREWCRLEDQTELNDIVSAIQSAMPGAVLVGDYAIESSNRISGERLGNRNGNGNDTERGRWLSTLFLFRMIGSLEGAAPRRGNSGQRRGSRTSRHRYIWGENLLGLQDELGDMEEEAEVEEEEDDDDDETNINEDEDERGEPRLENDEQNEDHNP